LLAGFDHDDFGIHFALADLNGDGRPEIIAPGKEGLFVYFNEDNH